MKKLVFFALLIAFTAGCAGGKVGGFEPLQPKPEKLFPLVGAEFPLKDGEFASHESAWVVVKWELKNGSPWKIRYCTHDISGDSCDEWTDLDLEIRLTNYGDKTACRGFVAEGDSLKIKVCTQS